MYLNIEIPKNLSTEMRLKSAHVPCLCVVGKEFKIEFDERVFANNLSGKVVDWDMRELNIRVAGLGGGKYTYNHLSQVTLKEVDNNKYKITDLRMFSSVGWCDVIVKGDYTKVEHAED